MNRRRLVMASTAMALSVLAASAGGDQVAAIKRARKRGNSAFAGAKVTGTGGRVSVQVSCGSGRGSSDTNDTEATARC